VLLRVVACTLPRERRDTGPAKLLVPSCSIPHSIRKHNYTYNARDLAFITYYLRALIIIYLLLLLLLYYLIKRKITSYE